MRSTYAQNTEPWLPRFVTILELLEHEQSIALRSYLLADGRDQFVIGENSLLPAERALIITNYRLIFKDRRINRASTWNSNEEKRLPIVFIFSCQ